MRSRVANGWWIGEAGSKFFSSICVNLRNLWMNLLILAGTQHALPGTEAKPLQIKPPKTRK
jgi:hypothetical protein